MTGNEPSDMIFALKSAFRKECRLMGVIMTDISPGKKIIRRIKL